MKFVDEAIVRVKAGNGGDGIIAWRKESYVPLGGPCGGNGGNGGNIVLKVNENINSYTIQKL